MQWHREERRLGYGALACSLVVLLALGGCGSSLSQGEKQARIKAGLVRLHDEAEHAKAKRLREAWTVLKRLPASGVTLKVTPGVIEREREERVRRIEILVKASRPKGITSAEWNAAVKRYERRHRGDLE
jgi:hypothetical protein